MPHTFHLFDERSKATVALCNFLWIPESSTLQHVVAQHLPPWSTKKEVTPPPAAVASHGDGGVVGNGNRLLCERSPALPRFRHGPAGVSWKCSALLPDPVALFPGILHQLLVCGPNRSWKRMLTLSFYYRRPGCTRSAMPCCEHPSHAAEATCCRHSPPEPPHFWH